MTIVQIRVHETQETPARGAHCSLVACPATDGWQITGSHYFRLEQIGETPTPQIPHVGRFCCRDGPVRASVALMSRLHVWCSSSGHCRSRKEVATLNCERAKASSPRIPLHPALCPQPVAWQKRGSGIKLILAWLPLGANTPVVHLEEGIEPCAGSWCALS